MPRANRCALADHICHVTHRCHDRSFLLRFARDRDDYRLRLRSGCETTGVRILTCCITSNHVHLVTSSVDRRKVAALMQRLEGDAAARNGMWTESIAVGSQAYVDETAEQEWKRHNNLS